MVKGLYFPSGPFSLIDARSFLLLAQFFFLFVTPDLCSARFMLHCEPEVGLVGGVFDPLLKSAIAVFEHVKDELAVIPYLLLATL